MGDLTVSIEFCSGNGDWIVEKALLEPHRHFVAVELRYDRVQKIEKRVRNRGVKNLTVVRSEAYLFVKESVRDRSVQDVFINFPDPWPKRRHAKHRLIQEPFLNELARVMTGSLTLATDDANYMNEALRFLDKHPDFEGGRCQIEGYGTSYFDALWREKGKEIFYATYRRQPAQD